jgi:hypothetical protein
MADIFEDLNTGLQEYKTGGYQADRDVTLQICG